MSIDAVARGGLALLALALAGTGAAAADAALIAAAKNERQVVWYTTLIVNQYGKLFTAGQITPSLILFPFWHQ